MRALGAMIVCVLSSSAHAELDGKGVRVGSGISELYLGDSVAPAQAGEALPFQPDLHLGAFITQRFSRVFAIQPELRVLVMRGFSESCVMGPCMKLFDVDFYMLELPVLARLDLLPTEQPKLHLDAGPVLVLPLGGVFHMGDDTLPVEDMNPINFGIAAGIGVEFGAGPGYVTIDVRYQRYVLLLAAPENPSDDTSSGHQLAVSVGYGFP